MDQYSKYSQVLKETQNTPLKLYNSHRMSFNSRKFTCACVCVCVCVLDIVVAERMCCEYC